MQKGKQASYNQNKVDPLDLLVTILLVENKGQAMDAGVVLDTEQITTRQLTTILTKLRGRSASAKVMLRVLDVRAPPAFAARVHSSPVRPLSVTQGDISVTQGDTSVAHRALSVHPASS